MNNSIEFCFHFPNSKFERLEGFCRSYFRLNVFQLRKVVYFTVQSLALLRVQPFPSNFPRNSAIIHRCSGRRSSNFDRNTRQLDHVARFVSVDYRQGNASCFFFPNNIFSELRCSRITFHITRVYSCSARRSFVLFWKKREQKCRVPGGGEASKST